MHFFVDLICAWSMFAFFSESNYERYLLYNFCAFALQMPLGTLLDLLRDRVRRLPAVCASLGALITVLGALLNPAVLGIGNALFHVGAGVGVIEEDADKNLKGRLLGLFVAPGAIGLYVGTNLGKQATVAVFPIVGVLTAALLIGLFLVKTFNRPVPAEKTKGNLLVLTLCCFAVVVLRSWVGLTVSFPWKENTSLALFAVLSAAGGKVSGGLLAARFGFVKTAAVTLLLASVCYLGDQWTVPGLAAIFLFNMSMPLTLYLLIKKLPRLPGFSFGFLTFGLFLGFLPVYMQVQLPIGGALFGAFGSIMSCILLIIAGKVDDHDKISA